MPLLTRIPLFSFQRLECEINLFGLRSSFLHESCSTYALQFTKATHRSHGQGQNENSDILVPTISCTLPKTVVFIYSTLHVMTSNFLYHLTANHFDPSLCHKAPRSPERFSDLSFNKKTGRIQLFMEVCLEKTLFWALCYTRAPRRNAAKIQ